MAGGHSFNPDSRQKSFAYAGTVCGYTGTVIFGGCHSYSVMHQPQEYMNQVALFEYLCFNVIYSIKVFDLSN